MSVNEELARVDLEINQLQEKLDKIQDDASLKMMELNERKNSLCLIKLLEDQILKNSEWELRLYNSKIILGLLSNPNDLLGCLRNLFDASWHSLIDLTDSTRFRFEDNDLLLIFSEFYEMIDFVNLHRLKIDLSNLNQEIERIKSLESMRDELNKKLILN